MSINLCLDLPAIANTLERRCKYEVNCLNKKTQYAETRVIAFLEVGRPGGKCSKGLVVYPFMK